MNGRGVPEDEKQSTVTRPWQRITNLALPISALGGLGLGLVLGITRPGGERLQGPLGLLFMGLVAATAVLALVSTVGDKRS